MSQRLATVPNLSEVASCYLERQRRYAAMHVSKKRTLASDVVLAARHFRALFSECLPKTVFHAAKLGLDILFRGATPGTPVRLDQIRVGATLLAPTEHETL